MIKGIGRSRDHRPTPAEMRKLHKFAGDWAQMVRMVFHERFLMFDSTGSAGVLLVVPRAVLNGWRSALLRTRNEDAGSE